jgi:putative PIN family toxin of toxin-antitoxin system
VRLVLDTNVIASALLWGGVPYKLVEAGAAGDIELVASPALLAELRDVLGRKHLTSRLVAQRASVEQAIGFYGELVISMTPPSTPRVVPGDIDDDQVIAAAVAGSAKLIVSGDRHLLSMGSHQGIAIVNAADAVRRVEEARTKT